MSEEKLSRDVAESEFDTFCERFGIENDLAYMNEEMKTTFIQNKERVVKALMRGSMKLNESQKLEYTPQDPESVRKEAIVFHSYSGKTLMNADRIKKNEDIRKTHAILAGITQLQETVFSNLHNQDYKIVQSVLLLFLG